MNLPSSKIATPKPDYVWSIKSIFEFFDQVDSILKEPVNSGDIEGITQAIATLLTLYPASSDVCASADWYLSEAYRLEYEIILKGLNGRGDEMSREAKKVTSASNLKEYINSRLADWHYIKRRADRLNSAITHSLDGLRSILSKEKESMRIANYATQV